MKSRKSLRRTVSRSDLSKNARRNKLRSVETLEKRELLASDFAVTDSGWFSNETAQENVLSYLASRFDNGGGGSGGEGGPNDIVNVTEVEPNDSFATSQLVPLAGNLGVNVSGTNPFGVLDEDWFAVDLQAGAILDARLVPSTIAGLPMVSIIAPTGRELIASQALPTSPEGSPLAGSASDVPGAFDIAAHYIVPTAGRYHVRISDASGPYTLQLRQYRAPTESLDTGEQQTLFLDFDGATIQHLLFGNAFGVGSVRLSPTREFLPQYGIQDSDYERFIDEVVNRVQAKFDQLGADTTNPNYGIQILNSKDHADPWGLPNVSRVVIAGTFQELVGDPDADGGLLGIAESVDAGNFALEETALVMHDTLIATVNDVALDPFARRVDVIAELMALVIAHEAGHYFGGRHQDPDNAIFGIMDQFYDPLISSGSGDDGIFGNADDEPLLFNVDRFTAQGVFVPGGVDDTINWLGWALSKGSANAATITGQVFNDLNANGIKDTTDGLLANVRVYSDTNGNGAFEAGEPTALTGLDGTYSLLVGAGTNTVRQIVPDGFRLTTPASRTVTVGADATIGGVDFGNSEVNPQVTGRKWNDANANGVFDANESPIEGIWIYIDTDGDNRIDIGEPSTRTGEDGTYTLQFPGAGTYTIREVLETGFRQTFPGPNFDNEHTITLTGDPSVDNSRKTGLDFGNLVLIDHGDAPASYGDASHGFVDGLLLGAEWDPELEAAFSPAANGDDTTGRVGVGGVVINDEDGVRLGRPLVAGSSSNRIIVDAVNTTEGSAYLTGWFDINSDGSFQESEKLISNFPMANGVNSITFAIPNNAEIGPVMTRFRYSADTGIAATGLVATGEVEDYLFEIASEFRLANDDVYDVSRNSALNFLDVLANDFRADGETLTVISADQTTAGGVTTVTNGGTGILYTPPSGFIGRDTFTYRMQNSNNEIAIANVTINVNLRFEDPFAVDDSFNVIEDSVNNPLNVLANDIEGEGGALNIVSVTQPDKGGEITIGVGGQSLQYTPRRGFGGTEFFTYTAADGFGDRTTATVTLHTLPGDRTDDLVEIELVATDLNGNTITAVEQGTDFQVRMFVDDLRFENVVGDPGIAAGVFAAYADVLYDLQLVSTVPSTDPDDGFSYEVRFENNYVNGRQGNASIPGLINEFGAFTSLNSMNVKDSIHFATITFNARQPGIANFTPDPADVSPLSDTLLFDTTETAVPRERIRYLGTRLEIFGSGVEFPVAVDDSVIERIPVNSAPFPIDVLANDLPGSTGDIEIVSLSDGRFGNTFVDNSGTPEDPSDDVIRYTPTTGFFGADQFTYRIEDGRGIQDTATVTLRVGQNADDNDLVALNIQVTDESGLPITETTVGSRFQVRGTVQDLRGIGVDRGAFAAYQDILYSSGLVSPIATADNDPDLGFQVEFGEKYNRVREGDIRTTGVINEIGSVQTDESPSVGSNEELLFVITMTADASGVANFISDPADITPLHDVLIYAPPGPVNFDQIRFGFDSLTILAGDGGGEGEYSQNPFNQFDVNADGFVTPLDALLVIHGLNTKGQAFGEGEGGDSETYFYDVSGDGKLSAIDGLMIINELNQPDGEGEAYVDLGPVRSGPTGQALSEDSSTAELIIEKDDFGRITARETNQVYGPSMNYSLVNNPFADVADDDDELGLMLDDLATEVNDHWNRS
ncbi:MAG: Ig-like domain-containing protein [Planctomycetota bacterium]